MAVVPLADAVMCAHRYAYAFYQAPDAVAAAAAPFLAAAGDG
jgi:hypothetical protein